jgi:hypothetical protein
MSDDKQTTAQELIKRLARLSGPNRGLDGEIGKLIGYTRRTKTDTDSASGKQIRMAVWDSPSGDEVRMPHFTRLLHDAYSLAQTILPDNVGGASWDETSGAARIADGPYVTAANAAIAICIAALDQLEEGAFYDDDSEGDLPE